MLDPSHRRRPVIIAIAAAAESYGQTWYIEAPASSVRLLLGAAVYHRFSIFLVLRFSSPQPSAHTRHHACFVASEVLPTRLRSSFSRLRDHLLQERASKNHEPGWRNCMISHGMMPSNVLIKHFSRSIPTFSRHIPISPSSLDLSIHHFSN